MISTHVILPLQEEIAHKLVTKQLFLSLTVCPRDRTILCSWDHMSFQLCYDYYHVQGQLVLVSDHEASGQFLIHYFISQALKGPLFKTQKKFSPFNNFLIFFTDT